MYIERLIKEATETGELLKTNVDEIGLSDGVLSKLERMGVLTIFDLVQKTKMDFIRVRGFGKISMSQVESRLKEHGLCLGMAFDFDFVNDFVLNKPGGKS